jgi:phosphatidylinositol-3-phosphatase
MTKLARILGAGTTLLLSLCGCSSMKTQSPGPAPSVPAHIVIVMEENRSYAEIIGSPDAPYINSLATQGALFTQSFAIGHPSQPNYLALISGSTQGITDDSCPHDFSVATLESELLSAAKSFAGYSEDLPQTGSDTCGSGEYARKHAPWVDFTQDQPNDNQPFSSFPSDFTKLPLVSFVIPNLLDDMHDGTIQQGDAWLKDHLSSYVDWAMTNNSVLIVTWDEDDGTQNNQVATIFVGGPVKAGQYSESINHYNVLRTIENFYGLSPLGDSQSASSIRDVWK